MLLGWFIAKQLMGVTAKQVRSFVNKGNLMRQNKSCVSSQNLVKEYPALFMFKIFGWVLGAEMLQCVCGPFCSEV